MDRIDSLRLLQTMIDYFETGNQQTDAVAKAILASDLEFDAKWQTEIKRLRNSTDWTGLRAPEAEILAAALHLLREVLAHSESSSNFPDER